MRPLLTLVALALLTGCAAPAAEEPIAPAGAQGEAPAPEEVRLGLVVSVPCGLAPACTYAVNAGDAAFTVERPGPSRATVTAEWSPSTPLSERLRARVFIGDEAIAEAAGASPLALDVPTDALRERHTLVVKVGPESPGAARDQAVTVRLDLEYAPHDGP